MNHDWDLLMGRNRLYKVRIKHPAEI
jgi:hypothetical protein